MNNYNTIEILREALEYNANNFKNSYAMRCLLEMQDLGKDKHTTLKGNDSNIIRKQKLLLLEAV